MKRQFFWPTDPAERKATAEKVYKEIQEGSSYEKALRKYNLPPTSWAKVGAPLLGLDPTSSRVESAKKGWLTRKSKEGLLPAPKRKYTKRKEVTPIQYEALPMEKPAQSEGFEIKGSPEEIARFVKALWKISL